MPSATSAWRNLPRGKPSKCGAIITEHVKMIGIASAALVHPRGRDALDLAQELGQVGSVLLAAAGLLFEPRELLEQKGGLELGHAEIGAVAHVREAGGRRAAAVVLKALALLDQFVAVCEDRTAFAGIEVLRALKAEAAQIAERAHLAAAPFGQVGLAGVFEHGDLVPGGDGGDRVQIGGRAAQVHGDDAAGSLGDGRIDLAGVDLKRFGIGVDEDGKRVVHEHGVDGGDEGIRRHDHLVAGTRLQARPAT